MNLSKKEVIQKAKELHQIVYSIGFTTYHYCDSYSKLLNIISNKKNICEYIHPDIPVPLFFDIDIKDPEYNTGDLLNSLFDIINKHFSFTEIKKTILTSHSQEKKSFHIIYRMFDENDSELLFNNVGSLKNLYNDLNLGQFVYNNNNNEMKPVVDISVYRDGIFRTIHSSKPNESRPFILQEGTELDSFVMNHSNTFTLISDIPSETVLDNDKKEVILKFIYNKYNISKKDISKFLVNDNSFDIRLHTKYCNNITREHTSNHQHIVLDSVSCKQRCYDSDCKDYNHNVIKSNKYPKKVKEIVDLSLTKTNQIISRANSILGTPEDTSWIITKHNKGIKAIPNCQICLIDPSVSHDCSSHLFVNTADKSVIKSCDISGSEVMSFTDSKQIINILNLHVNTSNEESLYQQLINDLLKTCSDFSYKREKLTGVVYQKIKSYAYIKKAEPMDFLNDIFYGDKNFIKNVNNMDNMIKFMKQFDHYDFPFIEFNKDYIGFNNGLLNIVTCEFTPEQDYTDTFLAYKFIDKEFTFSTDTPLFDTVFDFQFESEVKNFIYSCLGRLFGIRDDLGFMLYLLGESGTGKSVVLEVMSECFNNIGAISNSFESKFGLSYLYDKDLIVCDDLPKDIHTIFPQQDFQTIVTGGKISCAVKNGSAINVFWKTPLLFAGNWLPSYLDQGQISRRLLVANFEKNVYKPDTTLKKRIIDIELPSIIYKCLTFYKDLLIKSGGIWNICPEYFLDSQEELRMDKNPLFRFLTDHTIFKRDNFISLIDIKEKFSEYMNGKKVSKLDNGTFGQVNQNYNIEIKYICKSCKNSHKSGCCEQYTKKNRTKRQIVCNIDFFEL